ncbi:MAG: SDR family oxidoreductase [Verrucomicrobiales bacterium]|nr:SDR family oxidoreductase [Verrucomicrobiales bacterium]
MEEPDIHTLFNLNGRNALITGASGYLGSSMARALAEAGATVVVGSREESRAAETAAGLPTPSGQSHLGVAIDNRNETAITSGFTDAVSRAGKIDILINNGHAADSHDWSNVSASDFDAQLSNATGYFLLARHLRDHLVERNSPGNILMIGSMYGVVGSYPDAYEGIAPASPVHYHTLKGGIIHMARHLAVYWAKDQVRVNCLSPGPFPSDKAPEEMVERLIEKSPMKRMGLPHELKGAMLLLISDAGSYITGQNLLVDGGWTSW